MSQIKDLLKNKFIKGTLSIKASASVSDAIIKLGKYNIGFLLVISQEVPVGFISERILLRWASKIGLLKLAQKTVEEVMTKEMHIAKPDDDISHISNVMIKNNIRHLPIVSQQEVIGLISIGDVVNKQISEEIFKNQMLHNYIEGQYPC